MNHAVRRRLLALPVALLAVSVFSLPAEADHTWGGYHWGRTSNGFTIQLGSNLSRFWQPYLSTTASDWSKSSVLDTVVVPGQTTKSRCGPTVGRVEVCNSAYGQNQWLGIAQVWVSGTHITQGVVKMNDTYFNLSWYNTPAWRNHVMCQEVGHTFGLDHQDESGADLGTCMDYSRDPRNSQHPNAHDYAELEAIYGHADSTTTVGVSSSAAARATAQQMREWGRAIRHEGRSGRPTLFERRLGGAQAVYTFVIWAE
ncbi:MAG TPA: hypothetical protein VHG90_11205 [Acidimicrobiales bacterium]|nr:hypothetical protein [Acidimicrobiales bacterium]